tara:strand:- start:679 stop:807 length:129 start_codon:yes stop_codon:yes gene_type:complete
MMQKMKESKNIEESKLCEKPPTKIFEGDIAMVDTDVAGNRLS